MNTVYERLRDFEYKVIRIVDEYSVLINVGAEDGIAKDDLLEIFSVGTEIKDPETGNTIGTFDTIKAVVVADTVYDKFCLCKNHDFTSFATVFGAIPSALGQSRKVLQVNPADIIPLPDDHDHTVYVGDKVRVSRQNILND